MCEGWESWWLRRRIGSCRPRVGDLRRRRFFIHIARPHSIIIIMSFGFRIGTVNIIPSFAITTLMCVHPPLAAHNNHSPALPRPLNALSAATPPSLPTLIHPQPATIFLCPVSLPAHPLSFFETPSPNLPPGFRIGCMGILPYYARYGLSGEQPRTKDDFERYEEQKGAWESVRGWQWMLVVAAVVFIFTACSRGHTLARAGLLREPYFSHLSPTSSLAHPFFYTTLPHIFFFYTHTYSILTG